MPSRFLLLVIAAAGVFASLELGRAEDPSFTIKVLTVTAVWPGATAQQMQDLVAEPLEKRLQELTDYDRVETFTRLGLALMTVTLKNDTNPKNVPEEFYQARKNWVMKRTNYRREFSAPSSTMSIRM